jgi:ribonuclease E
MENPKHQREVENRLRDALHHDRARVQTSKISRFGLLEMSRQRLQPSLGETSYNPCPRCHGTGHIRGTESSALHILRILQEEAMKENTGALHVQLPVDVATFLLNEKRVDIHALETRLKVNVVLIPNIHMETPNYTITRLRHDELNRSDVNEPSYKLAVLPETETIYQTDTQAAAPARQQAAVKSVAPPQPTPAPQVAAPVAAESEAGLFNRIFGWFKKLGEEKPAEAPAAVLAPAPRPQSRERGERKPGQRSRGRGEGRGERNGEERGAARGEPRQADRKEGRETRVTESAKPQRQPRQPKPRPEAEATTPRAPETAPAAIEAGGEVKREPRSRRSRGRRSREDRVESPVVASEASAVAATASTEQGFHAIIEIARKARPAPVVSEAAPAQQALQLESSALPAVTASPAEILAELATSAAALQQVETQGEVIESAASSGEPQRSRRRRRPTTKPTEAEVVSLMQVETTAPVTEPHSSAPTAPLHPTRRRARPQAVEAQEPLVQVETQSPQ